MASMLYGFAGKLLGELCSPLFKTYVVKPWGFGNKKEFEKLENTVSAIEAVLIDADEKQRTNRQVRDWLIKIKLVFYDLEDLLQEVRTEALKRQVMTRNKKAKKGEVGCISSDRNAFNFTDRREEMPANRSRKREETHSFVHIDNCIGRDADKEYVTSLLFQTDGVDNVSVISIVGIGGLGKTTLAQSIYHSKEVKEKFDLRMWVCVSDPFDVQLICENIIESATHNRCKRLQLDGVKDELKKAIDGRKYLLILDDVWNDKNIKWSELEVLLRGGATGSKILITTRSRLVAQAAKSSATHVLKVLSPEDSWVLFKKVAFKRGVEQMSPTIEGIGKEVVEKCFGVPLVVKAIGSLLAVKEREVDWLDFKKNDLPRVTQDSEGSVLPSLRLSYDYLSAPLKICFVYCAIYPKDYEIKKDKLIGMWMAHGLIQLDHTTRSLEDVGDRHFMGLLDRSFFEVHESAFERGSCYKMHDLIHDLAQSVGGEEFYNSGSGTSYINRSTRHAWVLGDKITNIWHGEKLRTLVLTNSYDEHQVNEFVRTFEQLRVLRLENLMLLTTVQKYFVGGLRHLSYLDLSYSMFESLPESICSLYNLQTLILVGCRELTELPARTRDLVSLRCLDLSGCLSLERMPRGLEELTCLQTLSEFVSGSWEEGDEWRNYAEVCELKTLVNLRGSLKITSLRGSKSVKTKRNKSCVLTELKFIKQLELDWMRRILSDGEEKEEEEEELFLFESLKPPPNLEKLIIEHYGGEEFPSWMDRGNIGISLPNIVSLHLSDFRDLRHLPPLGLLPSMQRLHISCMNGIEYLIDSSSSTLDQQLFPSLKELYLGYMSKFTRLVGLRDAYHTDNILFPVLEKLQIVDCPFSQSVDEKQFLSLREACFGYVNTLPASLQYLPHLHTLEVSNCYEMVSLPEWIGNLTSLQELRLTTLPLAYIPDCMQRLTSLQRLLIRDCRKLASRCEKETGADWHKIAHIPSISVKIW